MTSTQRKGLKSARRRPYLLIVAQISYNVNGYNRNCGGVFGWNLGWSGGVWGGVAMRVMMRILVRGLRSFAGLASVAGL